MTVITLTIIITIIVSIITVVWGLIVWLFNYYYYNQYYHYCLFFNDFYYCSISPSQYSESLRKKKCKTNWGEIWELNHKFLVFLHKWILEEWENEVKFCSAIYTSSYSCSKLLFFLQFLPLDSSSLFLIFCCNFRACSY